MLVQDEINPPFAARGFRRAQSITHKTQRRISPPRELPQVLTITFWPSIQGRFLLGTDIIAESPHPLLALIYCFLFLIQRILSYSLPRTVAVGGRRQFPACALVSFAPLLPQQHPSR